MGDAASPPSDQDAPPQPPPEQPPPTPEEICTPEVLDSIVKGYSKDCELIDFSAKLGTKVGDNYMSIMYAVELRLKNRKTLEEQELRVMLKTMPRNAVRIQMINESGAFVKEAKIYEEVLPLYEKLQAEKGIPASEMFRPWPQCYITFNDGKNDYLAMEDLKTEGYKMANRVLGLNEAHARLMLQNLAKFHALSYATFGGSAAKIMSRFPWLEEKMFLPLDKMQDNLKMWLISVFKSESGVVRGQGHTKEADLMDKLGANDEFWDYMHLKTSGKGREGDAVINHGDCWTNNVLFKYGENGTTPSALKFVDFQLARCCSRSTDLNYFLHTSIPAEEFNKNEETYLKFYHEEFVAFLARLGVDEEAMKQFTFEGLLEDFNEHKLYGVVMGFMLAPILSAEASAVPDMENISEEEFTSEGAEKFFNQLSSASSDKKVVNLAVNHLPRCKLDKVVPSN